MDVNFLDDSVLWGIAVWQAGLAAVLILTSFLTRFIMGVVFGSWLRKRTDGTEVRWDDDLVELAPKPLGQALRIFLWYAAAVVLSLPQAPSNVRLWVLSGIELALWVSIIYLAFNMIDVLTRVLERAAARTETVLDDQIAPLVQRALKVFIAAVFVIMIVQNMGVEVGSLLASLGIGGLALALAAKDTVANFFGSMIIFIDQPFQIGEVVEIKDVHGTVEEVRFRSTLIRRFDKSLVTVPNQFFTNNNIVNHARRPRRRMKITVGLSYETNAAQMRLFVAGVNKILDDYDGIDDEFKEAVFAEFGESSLDVLIVCFSRSNSWVDTMAAQEYLMLRIMELVEEQGLEIAFPTRTIYTRSGEKDKESEGSSRDTDSGPGVSFS